jgi:hypothetical protein
MRQLLFFFVFFETGHACAVQVSLPYPFGTRLSTGLTNSTEFDEILSDLNLQFGLISVEIVRNRQKNR